MLTAEQALLLSQVNLVRSQRDEIVAAYQLKEAVGGLSADQLQLPVDIYKPADFYRQERNKVIGLGVSDLPEPSKELTAGEAKLGLSGAGVLTR